MNRTRSIVTLLLSVLVCLSVGGSASLMTSTSVRSWYPLIQKPSWTPPDALFGPVEHLAHRAHLGGLVRPAGINIHDDAVIRIDEVIVGICKESGCDDEG